MGLPASLRRGSDIEAIRDDVAPYRGTSAAERSEIMSRLCRFAAEQVAARADRARILAFQEPLSARSLALWRRLVSEGRAG